MTPNETPNSNKILKKSLLQFGVVSQKHWDEAARLANSRHVPAVMEQLKSLVVGYDHHSGDPIFALTDFQIREARLGRASELWLDRQYLKLNRVGAGGMGEVFVAHDGMRLRAIKTIRADYRIEEISVEQKRRFGREAKLLAQLDHPGLPTLYRFVLSPQPFIAMEWLRGRDVEKWARQEHSGQVPVETAARIVFETARVLQYAHDRKITHRDIKPGNIFYTDDDRIVLLDLGLAKLASDLSEGTASLTGAGLGTREFMAPEQLHNAKNATAQADIFSLGTTLYYILAGRSPFQDCVGGAFVFYRAHAPVITPISSLRPDVPQELSDLAIAMMAEEPSQRCSLNLSMKILSKYTNAPGETWIPPIVQLRRELERLELELEAKTSSDQRGGQESPQILGTAPTEEYSPNDPPQAPRAASEKLAKMEQWIVERFFPINAARR